GQPHNWSNYFLGQHVTEDPGPLFYPVALLFRLGPVALGGMVVAIICGWRRPADRVALFSLAGFALGFMALMTVGGKKFDRYMLPAIVRLDLLAGVGVWLLARRLRTAWIRRVAVLAVLVVQLALFWRSQPYPIASYNPLLGGTPVAERMLMLGWGEGLEQVARY